MRTMRFFIFIALVFLIIPVLPAQNLNYTVSGTVKDAKTGETLIGVSITTGNASGIGTVTNEYGFYSLTLPPGAYDLVYSYVGYETVHSHVQLNENKVSDIQLGEKADVLNTVDIQSEKEEDRIMETEMNVEKINMQVMNKIPVFMGERDVFKTIQLLPGVLPAGDGNSGFYVRGGSADQNLILLDEAVVYNPSHLMGFFSTFNSDAIKDATLYKGSVPAQYGGRMSSVLDVKMIDGDNQNYHVSGGVGLISAHLNVEGPIEKGKSSFFISGRRTYADVFLKLLNDSALSGTSLYFYDINAKLNFQLGQKSRLYVSGYYGADQLGLGSFGMGWSNGTATLRWNYIINPKLFSNTIFTFSDYKNDLRVSLDSSDVTIHSEIMDFNLRQEFQYYALNNLTFRFGYASTFHNINPGQYERPGDTASVFSELTRRYSWENAIYANGEWKLSSRVKMQAGLRLVAFSVIGGGGDFYEFNPDGSFSDTIHTTATEFVTTYFNIEPRLSFNFRLTENTAIKVAYDRNTQFLHLLSNSVASNPMDKWVPSSNNIRPEISDQVSLGIFQNLKNNMFELSLEGYYKNMQNVVDYKDGADITNNELYESDLLYGEGRAYGMELAVRKNKGNFTGWVSYAFTRTEKKINGINDGGWYPARQDRTHAVSLVLMYTIDRWTFSGNWVYYTGNAVTFPSGKYTVDGQTVFLYTERNGYRMPDYHRMDLGVTVDLKRKKFPPLKPGQKEKRRMITSELSFGAYNTYAQHNPYIISFKQDVDDPSITVAQKTYLFSIVPYVSYNFKF